MHLPPAALPSEPTLRAHVMRMRSLRPGLHMHSDDTREARDMVAQTEIDEGVRIVLLLDGLVDVSYGQRRMSLRCFAGRGGFPAPAPGHAPVADVAARGSDS